MPLPKDLKPIHIKHAVAYVEKQTAELVDLYLEQANVFSAIVGIFGVKALHAVSPYKKHKHPDVAQQRFPDLSLRWQYLILHHNKHWSLKEARGLGRFNPITIIPVGTSFGVIWLTSRSRLNPGYPVVIWRVDVIFLTAKDWKYEGSKAEEGKGGRTHTFGVSNPAEKLARGRCLHAARNCGKKW